MPNNPVESEQQELDAKAWENFGLCLSDLKHRVQALPISDVQKGIFRKTCEYFLDITEWLEG